MRRFHAALGTLTAAAAVFALVFTWQPGLASMYDDSVSYLIQAQAFSPFGAAPPAVLAAAAYQKYPPLFAALLALTGGAFDWRVAHALVAIAFAASVYLFGVLARRVTGSAWIAVAAALVYAWLPGSWLNVKGILSEFPYMALTFAALAVHDASRDKPLARGAAIGLGALLAAVLLTRTIGVALLAGIAFAEGLRFAKSRDPSRLRALAWAFAVPIAAGALWYALRPAAGDDAYVSFGADVVRAASERGLGWTGSLVAMNAAALRDGWLHALLIFWGESWKPGFLVAATLGVLGLAAMLRRAAQGHADAAYAVAFLAILLLWPFPGQMFRLAFPVMPLVLLNAFWALQRLLALRFDARRAERWTTYAAALPIALAAPAVLFYIAARAAAPQDLPGAYSKSGITEFYRIPDRRSAERNVLAQIGVFHDMDRIRETTPAAARLMWYMPDYVALLAHRHGVPLRRPKDAADLAAQLKATDAHYIYLSNVNPRDSAGRDGNPLDPLLQARGLADVEWHRVGPGDEVQGVLLKVRRDIQ
jgi:4-amino-4-deoxy-L-arabinose transferase-like glycosyltransferase